MTSSNKGDWTFISMVEGPIGKGTFWLCECKCGKTAVRAARSTSTTCRKCADLKSLTGENSSRWKGGRLENRDGYILVLLDRSHPRANKAGYVLEHLLVIEESIGRPVQRSESVHHRNGIKSDNRIENLELWDKSHPAGQRNSEKTEFYMEWLKTKCDPKILKEFCRKILQE